VGDPAGTAAAASSAAFATDGANVAPRSPEFPGSDIAQHESASLCEW
jgi:hypothetical protein